MTFILQLLFQLARTYSQICVSKENKVMTVLCSLVIQGLWLTTTALGVKHVNDLDWFGITEYMLGGLIGVWLAFYIPTERISG